ncbi:MAG: hypothetical protein RJB05_1356 [Armatimonadota bacterium]
MQHQQRIYARAPGPGAIIRLAERFSGSEPWSISVTPADAKTGYRCVTLSGCDVAEFARHLATSLTDTVYVIDVSPRRLLITAYLLVDADADADADADVSCQTIVDLPLPRFTIVGKLVVGRTLRHEGLPLWAITLERLRRVPYATIAVLDQRDLLVEAPDVVYIAQGNILE